MDPEDIDTVFVAGASGGTGRAVLRLLAPRVGTVRALTRDPDRRDGLRARGADEVVVDDLLDPDDLVGALEGVDCVVSAVGSGPRDLLRGGPYVDGAGNRALVGAAVEAGADAFVMQSALGVGSEPSSVLGSLFDVAIGPIQAAKASAERAIRGAPLRHTILRPGVLTNGSRTDRVTVAEPGARLWGTVSRADVARLLVAAPATDAATDRTFEVVGRPRRPFRDRAERVDWRLP